MSRACKLRCLLCCGCLFRLLPVTFCDAQILLRDPVLPDREIALPNRQPTSAECWERFEVEFGIERRNPSAVLGVIESMKYGLDVLVFSVDLYLRQLDEALEFEYEQGAILPVHSLSHTGPRIYPNPFQDALENARLKFDFEVATGKPYVGVRLVIPIGN